MFWSYSFLFVHHVYVLHSSQQKPTSRGAPGGPPPGPLSREDSDLSAELRELKEAFIVSQQENIFLRTQVQRLVAQLKKKEKQMQQVLGLKVSALSDAGSDAVLQGQLKELKNEMISIAKLTDKVNRKYCDKTA